jgi:N-acetylmuramoyl-L-alanine amidase
VIDLQDQVQYEAHRLANPERIYFDLHDTTLAAGLSGKTIAVDDVFLVRVRVAQPSPGITRVVLETKASSNYSVSLEQHPYRLVVEIRKEGAKPQSAKVDLFAPTTPAWASLPPASQSLAAAKIPKAPSPPQVGALQASTSEPKAHIHGPQFRIVLDAGHGGWDLGTVGRKGLLEKDLVLDIVERLGKLVEGKLDAEVIYTRQDDTYLPLEKRAEIANVAHANLFLSVHANYSDYASARGVETYYTNTYSSVRARTPEANAAGLPLQDISWTNVDIREKVKESHRFAASVQRALYGTLAAKNPGLRDRGVKEASYVVLTGTSMPAILAEVSFVSSPEDETELQSAAYRQQIAEALYKGLARYTQASQKVKMASTSDKPIRK